MITPENRNAADKKLVGSVLLYEADSIEDVRKLAEQDLHWTENAVAVGLQSRSAVLSIATFTGGEGW